MSGQKEIKVAILDDFQNVSTKFAQWPSYAKLTVFTEALEDVVEQLQPFEVLCTMRERTRFPREILEKLPNLKLLTTTGLRNAAIDLPALKERGVVVSGTDFSSASTLEHIWALIQSCTRYIPYEHERVKQGLWQATIPMELKGKTIGMLGLGKLGQGVAQIAKVFGMKVIVWSPNMNKERAETLGAEYRTREDFYKEADIVSVQLVLSDSTRGLVTKKDLQLMKPTAWFINTSRGPIVVEEDLIQILKDKKIAGAGLDVFDTEPLPKSSPWRKLDNVVISPHIGYVSDVTYAAWYPQTVENIDAFYANKPIRVLNK